MRHSQKQTQKCVLNPLQWVESSGICNTEWKQTGLGPSKRGKFNFWRTVMNNIRTSIFGKSWRPLILGKKKLKRTFQFFFFVFAKNNKSTMLGSNCNVMAVLYTLNILHWVPLTSINLIHKMCSLKVILFEREHWCQSKILFSEKNISSLQVGPIVIWHPVLVTKVFERFYWQYM